MTKALEGVQILDMTHVQSGPSATQILAWFGADVVKVEMPGKGDATRSQLRDIEDVDSLYFTMLNGNKRSITLNTRSEKGQEIFTELVRRSDVLVENFAPGALDRQGFTWERLQELNPRLIYASIKGFGAGPYLDCKAYENIAQAMGGSMSTTGWKEGPPTVSGAQTGDSGTGVHCVIGVLAALHQRTHTGKGQRVEVAMQDAVLNLCRVKMRDQQRLEHGPLPEYPQEEFGDEVPRAGNASGGGQPGTALQCAPGGHNDYIYVVIQPPGWAPLMKLAGREDLIEDPAFATPEARISRLDECFGIVEKWTKTQTKFDAMTTLNDLNVPCGPILSMKDIYDDEALYKTGTLARVKHPKRGEYVTVGCPIRLSDSPVEVKTSPLLGEHNAEVCEWLGFDADDLD